MSLPKVGTPVRTALLDGSLWHTEWTFAAADSVPTLDTAKSDRDERVPTPIAANATGIVDLKFPKCNKARVVGKNFSPGTPGTTANFRVWEVCDLDAAAGTATVRYVDLDGTPTAAHPSAASRCSVTLLLEAI